MRTFQPASGGVPGGGAARYEGLVLGLSRLEAGELRQHGPHRSQCRPRCHCVADMLLSDATALQALARRGGVHCVSEGQRGSSET